MADFRRQGTYSKQYLADVTFALKKLESENLLSLIGNFLDGKKKILDIGCGIGVLASEVKDRYNSEVYGIDINRVAVKSAVQAGIKAKVGDIEKKLPYGNESFDAVLIIQVIEHVLGTDDLVLEAKRVLKENGLLIISTPNLSNWFNRIIFLFGFQPFFTEVSLKDKTFGLSFTRGMSVNRETLGHLRIFTLRALRDLLNYYGFKTNFIRGGNLYYLPKFMKPIDKFFSFFPGVASDLIVVAKRE